MNKTIYLIVGFIGVIFVFFIYSIWSKEDSFEEMLIDKKYLRAENFLSEQLSLLPTQNANTSYKRISLLKDMAMVKYFQGKFTEAHETQKEVVKLLRNNNSDSILCIDALDTLFFYTALLNEYLDAKNIKLEIISLRSKVLLGNANERFQDFLDLAWCEIALNNFDATRDILTKSENLIKTREAAFLFLLQNVDFNLAIDDRDNALKFYEEARRQFAIHLSSNEEHEFQLSQICAQLFFDNAELPESEKFLREIIIYEEEKFGKNSPIIFTELDLLTQNLIKQKKYSEAKQLCEQARKIALVAFPENSLFGADILLNEGKYYLGIDDPVSAEISLNKASSIIDEKLGKTHSYYADVCYQIAKCYLSQHKFNDSLESAICALEIQKRLYIPDSKIMKETRELIDEIKKAALGKNDDSQNHKPLLSETE